MSSKTSLQSLATLTEMVLPNDTNNLDNLMGGRLLHWMDIAAAISAHRHCGRIVVTASVGVVAVAFAIAVVSLVICFGQPFINASCRSVLRLFLLRLL